MLKPSRLTATFLPASLLIFPPIAGLAASSFGGAATAVAFFKVFFTSFALSLLSPAFLEPKTVDHDRRGLGGVQILLESVELSGAKGGGEGVGGGGGISIYF